MLVSHLLQIHTCCNEIIIIFRQSNFIGKVWNPRSTPNIISQIVSPLQMWTIKTQYKATFNKGEFNWFKAWDEKIFWRKRWEWIVSRFLTKMERKYGYWIDKEFQKECILIGLKEIIIIITFCMNCFRELPPEYIENCPVIDGRYKVLFKLGSGRFSKYDWNLFRVRMAIDLATNQRVAIKIMN